MQNTKELLLLQLFFLTGLCPIRDKGAGMLVSKEQVIAMANLVRLDVTMGQSPQQAEETLERMQDQLSTIVSFMESINSVDTSAVEPLYSPMQFVAETREDTVIVRQTPDTVLANAPERQDNFFAVPPVI